MSEQSVIDKFKEMLNSTKQNSSDLLYLFTDELLWPEKISFNKYLLKSLLSFCPEHERKIAIKHAIEKFTKFYE